jgi:hypothetical protein
LKVLCIADLAIASNAALSSSATSDSTTRAKIMAVPNSLSSETVVAALSFRSDSRVAWRF